MFENIMKFFRKLIKSEQKVGSKGAAKERLHLVLMQDRANVSAEFLALMKQEIIEVIKKYIEVDENQIDVKLTNQEKEDGTTGAPVLYANIPIVAMKEAPKQPEKKEDEPVGVDVLGDPEEKAIPVTQENIKEQENTEVKEEPKKPEEADVGATISIPQEIVSEPEKVQKPKSVKKSSKKATASSVATKKEDAGATISRPQEEKDLKKDNNNSKKEEN